MRWCPSKFAVLTYISSKKSDKLINFYYFEKPEKKTKETKCRFIEIESCRTCINNEKCGNTNFHAQTRAHRVRRIGFVFIYEFNAIRSHRFDLILRLCLPPSHFISKASNSGVYFFQFALDAINNRYVKVFTPQKPHTLSVLFTIFVFAEDYIFMLLLANVKNDSVECIERS